MVTRVVNALFLSILLLSPFSMIAAEKEAATFVAGKDYKIVKVAPPVGVTVSKNSVIEFFNPGCPACFHTQPLIEKWLKQKPKKIEFSRVPLTFHPEWQLYSKAVYVARSLGIENEVVARLFDLIHVQNMPPLKQAEMTTVFTDITKKYSDKQINTAFNSWALPVSLSQAEKMMATYEIYEIPAFLVNGKYLVNGSMAKTPEKMLQIVDYLVKMP
jgi:thiol:disulfide interchange protein DsbA